MSEGRIYKYYLPDEYGDKELCETDTNSVIIIGPNGSGKSKLGAWIERQDPKNVHRVASQRSLNFSEHVPYKSFEESTGELFYGSDERQYWDSNKGVRWNWDSSNTTKLLDDFDVALSALLARYRSDVERFYNRCKEAESKGEKKPQTPVTVLDKLFRIWSSVFPHRALNQSDAKFVASLDQEGDKKEYAATQMSDGERSVLYLASQILCLPSDIILIIDEPELHLHPALMGRLWRALEQERGDCLFIYITHDTQFASEHCGSDKYWIKSFDGEYWQWEPIPDSDLPAGLLLDLLGNRRNVLFVEGTEASIDRQLYEALFPEFYIVPCGGCSQVIAYTKAYSSLPNTVGAKAYGIIDRDFRSDASLESLERKGVFSLKVAEVENLFITEEVLRVMARRFVCPDADSVVESIKQYVIEERFKPHISHQVNEATIFTLKELLQGIDIRVNNGDDAAASFEDALNNLLPAEVLSNQQERFESIAEREDYEEVLRVFNEKGLAKSVGHFMGVNDRDYCGKVIAMLRGSDGDEIREALGLYVPERDCFES